MVTVNRLSADAETMSELFGSADSVVGQLSHEQLEALVASELSTARASRLLDYANALAAIGGFLLFSAFVVEFIRASRADRRPLKKGKKRRLTDKEEFARAEKRARALLVEDAEYVDVDDEAAELDD
jgi:hypothetical protein